MAGAPGAGLRIFVSEPAAVASLKTRLELVAREVRTSRTGPIVVVAMKEDGEEVDVALPEPYPLTPQVVGALKAVPGVHVEEF